MANKKLRIYTYVGAVFMATYSSLPAYVNSSFLKQFISEKGIGWLYAAGSLITILLMLVTPRLIRHFGNQSVLLAFIFFSLLCVAPLAFPTLGVIHTLTIFALYIIFGYLTRYALDVYLENISENKKTGLIRGLYMTFYNFAWLISPLLAAYLVSHGNYNLVYAMSGLLIIPFFFIALFCLRNNQPASQDITTASEEIKHLWQDKTPSTLNIRRILMIDFLLQLFYAVMVVYMPLYLHDHIGLDWTTIGLIFTIMLLPFVLFELPLGRLADSYLGEKEVLIGGAIMIAFSTMACTFIGLPNWILWAVILFLTRTGAASIEIMKETYLFKKLDGTATGVIALSRINVPLSYLVGPIFVSVILLFIDFRYIFFLLGLVMLLSLKFAWQLKDTK